MKPFDYQEELASKCLALIKDHKIAYLSGEERVGKTLSSLLVAVKGGYKRVLITTKKKAIAGWIETIEKCDWIKFNYHITTPQSVHKATGAFDFAIIDEAHYVYSGFPKPSKYWEATHKFTKFIPILLVSATPCPQGHQALYHQFKLSLANGMWQEHKKAYSWYKKYADRDEAGRYQTINAGNFKKTDYTKVRHDEIHQQVKKFFVVRTRKDAGFEHEPVNKKHYIKLSDPVMVAIENLINNKLLRFRVNAKDYKVKPANRSHYNMLISMLEGGTMKIGEKEYVIFRNTEKIQYIKEVWGDNINNIIMYNFVAEGDKLKQHFKYTKILSGTSFAEGVDLSWADNLIIYSQNDSTCQFSQRRCRQANINRKEPIHVHYLLVRGLAQEKTYNRVVRNKNKFIDKIFGR